MGPLRRTTLHVLARLRGIAAAGSNAPAAAENDALGFLGSRAYVPGMNGSSGGPLEQQHGVPCQALCEGTGSGTVEQQSQPRMHGWRANTAKAWFPITPPVAASAASSYCAAASNAISSSDSGGGLSSSSSSSNSGGGGGSNLSHQQVIRCALE